MYFPFEILETYTEISRFSFWLELVTEEYDEAMSHCYKILYNQQIFQ